MEEQEKQTEYMRGVPPHDETAEQAVLCSMFLDRVRELALKYYPTKEEAEAEIVKGIHAVQLYEITIEHMTGTRIHEK